MNIERRLVAESSLEQFADAHNLTLVVNERSAKLTAYTGKRFWVSFKGIDIKGDGVLISASGNGNTEREAIEDLARELSEKRLVIDAMKDTRREVLAPRFILKGDPHEV